MVCLKGHAFEKLLGNSEIANAVIQRLGDDGVLLINSEGNIPIKLRFKALEVTRAMVGIAFMRALWSNGKAETRNVGGGFFPPQSWPSDVRADRKRPLCEVDQICGSCRCISGFDPKRTPNHFPIQYETAALWH